MKHRSPLFAALLLLVPAAALPAATLYWDGGYADYSDQGDGISLGGSGSWNSTLKNWDSGLSQPHVEWVNANNDTAVLGGVVSDLVTVDAPITAGSVTLSGPISLDLGDNSLTLRSTATALSGTAAATIKSTDGTGSLVVGAAQKWTNSSGILTISAPVASGDKLLTLETKNNNLDVTGVISGTGGLTITSTGGATSATNSNNPTLNNANDYSGTTTVSGWIWLNSGGVSAFGPDSSNLVFNSGGVRLTGAGTIDRGITFTGTSGISKISGNTTVNGKISGTGSLHLSANFQTGAAIILAAANDFTGDCLAGPDGTVQLAHVNALATANLVWNDNNGRSVYDLATNNLAYVLGSLKSVGNRSNNLNLGTAASGGGLVAIGANGQSNTYAGILSGTAGFKKVGSGAQTIIGANTYTGNTVVAEGTLKLGKIAGQTGASCTTGTAGTNAKRLTVPSSTNLYIGQAVSGALIPVGARIVSINTGTQVTLDFGPTTPAIATTVDFPDMVGSIAASPVVEIKSGATLDVSIFPWLLEATQTLGGSGTVVGAVTAAGILSPGLATVGTLTTGAVALTGTYACDLDGATCDKLVAGALTLTNAKLSFTAINPPTAASYLLATYTGTAPTPFTLENLPSGYVMDYATPGEIRLVGGATPPAYDTWASAKGLTVSNHGKGQDPDNDGAENLLEFALGGDPLSGADGGKFLGLVQPIEGSPALTLTLATRIGTSFGAGPDNTQVATKDGVSYRIERSNDLALWAGPITEVTPAIPLPAPNGLPPSGYEYHTFKTAGPVSTTAVEFIRAKISE